MNKMKRLLLLSVLMAATATGAMAQVNGGQYAFGFLRMANAPHVSSMGGIAVASPENDIAFTVQNPALMRPGLHNQLSLNYNAFYSDIGITNLQYGYHVPKLNTSFFGAVQYLNYGNFAQTDPTGAENGTFRAAEYAVTIGASRKYLEHWRYGASLKFAGSNLYSNYKASAMLLDVGINYFDTATLWDFGVVAKNMGTMLKTYNGEQDPLPFDLQIGVSKRFKHMPLRLFGTAHHLYTWDVRYDNPADRVTTSIIGSSDTQKNVGDKIGDKLFRHFIFGAELALGKHLVVTGSYNVMRRKELLLSTKAGVAGFALGLNLNLNKFQIHYARSFYYIIGPYNEIGLNLQLNKLFSMGAAGKKMHWDSQYDNWE